MSSVWGQRTGNTELLPVLLSCFSRAVEGNTAEEEERKNNSTKQRNAWKKLLQPSSLNFLCMKSSKIKAGITGRNATATALQEIKLDHNFSY